MVFRQQSDHLVGFRVNGKRSEAAKVAKNHRDDGALKSSNRSWPGLSTS